VPGGLTDIDLFGYLQIHCVADVHAPRTKYWHNPLTVIWNKLLIHANFITKHEPNKLMAGSNKRPDIAILYHDSSMKTLLDIRTCDVVMKSNVLACCQRPGHAAAFGVMAMDKAWLDRSRAQGDEFYPICHEGPGPGYIGVEALSLLDRASRKISSSLHAQIAYKTFWLQRLHMTNSKGVAAVILNRMPMSEHPISYGEFPSPYASFDMAHPNPHPISFPLPLPSQYHFRSSLSPTVNSEL
jgi:hypothetical protein